MNEGKSAIIIGATGLVGRSILELALSDLHFIKVTVFVRRRSGIVHPKLTEHVVDFDRLSEWEGLLQGDVLFSVLGTTIREAASREAQYKVDFEYQFEVAKAAAQNGVDGIVLISSTGARSSSPFFYLKTKGMLEEEIRRLGFKSVGILRPGPLTGVREVPRFSEKFTLALFRHFPKWKSLSSILPVKASQVSLRALQLAKSPSPVKILEAKNILFDD
jgi:uncharacterized protein YbjT (DUF2867 family)